MYRLGILAQGYIYPKEHHPKRDLPFRRFSFVRHRTSHILSLQSMVNRNLGFKMSNNDIKKLKVKDAEGLFDSSNLAFLAKNSITTIEFLKKIIKCIEKQVKSQARLHKEFLMPQTIPGVGNILSPTIMPEVGDINRFAKIGNYSSSCRCIKSQKLSNGKKKGENNRKNGCEIGRKRYRVVVIFAQGKK